MMLSSFKYILYLYLLLVPDLHSVSSSDLIFRVPSGWLSSLLPLLVQLLEARTGDLQRQLMLAQSELKAAREDAHIHELNKSQLQAQLAGEFLPAAPFHLLRNLSRLLNLHDHTQTRQLHHRCQCHRCTKVFS